MPRLPIFAVAAILVVGANVTASPTFPETDPQIIADYAELTSGVMTIDIGTGAAPGVLYVHGRQAFSIVRDEDEQVFVAAGRMALGRAVAFTHTTYYGSGTLNKPASDAGQLMVNVARWAGASPTPTIGVDPAYTELTTYLVDQGFTVLVRTPADLSGLDVFFTGSSAGYSAADLVTVRNFGEAGGGVVLAGTPWAYSVGDFSVNYPGNQMIFSSGVTYNGNYTWPSAGIDTVGPDPPCPLWNGLRAIDALTDHVQSTITLSLADQAAASATIMTGIGILAPAYTEFWDALNALMALLGRWSVIPTKADPVVVATEPLDALQVRYDDYEAQTLPPDQITAHPAGDDFPGAVPSTAPLVARTLTIDGTHPGLDGKRLYSGAGAFGWRSTGLYAAPGALLEVDLPVALIGEDIRVQIGCHSDSLLGKDSWTRSPRLVRSYTLDAVTTQAANAFGGPIYIVIPTGSTLGVFDVSIRGAVEAPRYVHGVTTLADWLTTVRDLPAPWAELEVNGMILTVQSADVRTLDDPVSLMDMWDTVMNYAADLAVIPRIRPRAERFVLDRQISAGWMHSGYPLMGHLESTGGLIDETLIRTDGSWGPFHEIGHNHQHRDWLIPHTTESSVNLWSVYISEEVFGIPRGQAHPAIDPAARMTRLQNYIIGGADYDTWDAWLGLQFYLQLQEGFGWAPYIDVFDIYNNLPDPERPTDDQQRIDQWLVRFSERVNRNLTPFFDCWGLPTTTGARDQVSVLPTWLEDPMRVHCAAVSATLAINRSVTLTPVVPVADVFDVGCSTLPHALCDEELVTGAIASIVLVGEVSRVTTPGLTLYEHSDATDGMLVVKSSDDVAFAVR